MRRKPVEAIVPLGPVSYDAELRRAFAAGGWREYADRYPELFDDLDVAQARSQASLGFHFHEWFAALVMHHATGYHALVGKYAFRKHVRKQEVLRSLTTEKIFSALCERRTRRTQAPDLLMFAPDRSDWFLCEVKGPRDRLRTAQTDYFETLFRSCGRPIYCLHLTEQPNEERNATKTVERPLRGS